MTGKGLKGLKGMVDIKGVTGLGTTMKEKVSQLSQFSIFRCVLASLHEGLSVYSSFGPSVGPSKIDLFDHTSVKGGLLSREDASL